MFTKEYATQAVAGAIGFIAPSIALQYVPIGFKDSKIKYYGSKIMVIAGLSAVSSLVSKNKNFARMVLIGGGISLLMDLWAEWQARSRPAAPATASGTSAFYGDDNMSAYYGDDARLGDDVSFD